MEPRRSLLACGVRGARWRVLSALGRERAPAPHCRRASAAAAAAASAHAASRGNSGCIFAHLHLRASTSSRIYFAWQLGLHLRSFYSGCIFAHLLRAATRAASSQLLLGLHLRASTSRGNSGCIFAASTRAASPQHLLGLHLHASRRNRLHCSTSNASSARIAVEGRAVQRRNTARSVVAVNPRLILRHHYAV
eukprot:COSAG06_NODE_289_length_18231_cov_20.202515_26_plen_193_part_00